MSSIVCTNDLRKNEWDVVVSSLDPSYAEVFFAFDDGNECTVFKDLSFGYTLFENGVEIYSGDYPDKNQKYISSDQQYLENVVLNFQPETSYKLHIWSINDKIYREVSYLFSTGIPKQPFPSWTWSSEEKRWISPVPPPIDIDYVFYDWDEDKQEWIKFDSEKTLLS